MKAKLRKYLLPFLLIILAGSVELVGVVLCGKMIPGYKNEVFAEEMNRTTQLMFVDEEDNSRFYPWLSYCENDFVTAEKYFKEKYTYEYVEKTLGISENDKLKDSSLSSYMETLRQELYSSEIEDFNSMIMFIIYVFDGENAVNEKTDFSKEVMINENKEIICLKNFECSSSDGKKKLLDLVMTLGNKEILYYRFRSENAKDASATEINQKSKELTEDVQFVIANFSKFFPENEISYSELTEMNDDNITNYDVEKQKDWEIYGDISDTTDVANKNIILEYFSGKYPIETFNYYYQDGMIYYSFGSDGCNPYPITIKLPSHLDKLQYSVFSYGDELMIVFSESNTSSEISDIILYYSISDEKITGFSVEGSL